MKKIWLKFIGLFRKKESRKDYGLNGGALKVDFRYLCQRRQRMSLLAEGLGMSVDEMVEAVKNRVLEDRRMKAKELLGKRRRR